MGKIKRGISLLLCCLLLGSILTAGSVTDVQASKQQTDTVTQQSIKNTDTTKRVSDDQTSDKAGQNEEKDTGEDAQTDTVESKETFFVLPVYREGTTAISTDRATGIQQIQEVGFTDPNFAAAVYDSLLKADWMGEPGQSVKDVLGSFTGVIEADGYARKIVYIVTAEKVVFVPEKEIIDISETFDTLEKAQAYYDSLVDIPGVEEYWSKEITQGETTLDTQKPESELIKNIEGIEWLRKAELIDFTNNGVSDLTPLSMTRISKIASDNGGIDAQEGKTWFGMEKQNVDIELSRCPIQKYPVQIAGRIKIVIDLEYNAYYPTEDIVYIKPENNSVSKYNIEIPVPLIKKGENRIKLTDDPATTNIFAKNIEGASFDDKKMTDDKFTINNVSYSGFITCGTGMRLEDGIQSWYAINEPGDLQLDNQPQFFSIKFRQVVRIYTKVKPKAEMVRTVLTLTKTDAETNEPVENAEFQLYKASKDAEGNYAKGELYVAEGQEERAADIYTTDKNGQINFEKLLPPGDYCLVETKAPYGYVMETGVLGFTVDSGEMTIGGGEPKVTPTGGTEVFAGENMTYIDRYSPNVELAIKPDEGMELDKVNITYFDRSTQQNQTKTYSTDPQSNEYSTDPVGEVQSFINAEKGSESDPGAIGGTVLIQPIYKKTVDIKTTNEPLRLRFQKVDEQMQEALEGAEFTLYEGDEETPSEWKKTKEPVISDEQGVVDFDKVNPGEYFLVETKAPKGYQKPTGYWKVKVTATKKDDEKISFQAVGDVPAISGTYADDYGFKITNREKSQLPALGGKGTTLFWISGLSVIGCALALCFKFKRKGA